MIQAILFDAEGVVLDTEPIWDEEQVVFMSKHGRLYERSVVKHLITGKSLQESTKILMNFYGIKGDLQKNVNERINIFQSILQKKISFVTGFKEFFDEMPRQLKTCIATSLRKESLYAVDKKLGIHELFQGKIFSIDDVDGKSKPDPAIFNYSANKLGVKSSECLVIEDSPNGIKAAKSAGMICVGLSTTFSADEIECADFICGTYREIKFKILEII